MYLYVFNTSTFHKEEAVITCGSAIKLEHIESGGKYFLHSPNTNWSSNGGSGQRSVTLIEDKSDPDSLWLVKEADGMPPCSTGSSIHCGDQIRLEHTNGQQNLHSHHFQSPLSKQQEISLFGTEGKGDDGDDWTVVCDKNYWQRNEPVRLLHTETGRFLGATRSKKFDQTNCGMGCPIEGHLEAFGLRAYANDKRPEFKATHGLYVQA